MVKLEASRPVEGKRESLQSIYQELLSFSDKSSSLSCIRQYRQD